MDKAYVPVGGDLVRIDELIKDNPHSMQFNDLLRSSCYSPMFAYRLRGNEYNEFFYWEHGLTRGEFTRFFIGGEVPCLRCGHNHLEVTETMQCIKCEEEYGTLDDDDFGYCDCCGRHIFLENGHWISDNDVLCNSCYENETGRCDHCGEVVYKSELVFSRDFEEYLCANCRFDCE